MLHIWDGVIKIKSFTHFPSHVNSNIYGQAVQICFIKEENISAKTCKLKSAFFIQGFRVWASSFQAMIMQDSLCGVGAVAIYLMWPTTRSFVVVLGFSWSSLIHVSLFTPLSMSLRYQDLHTKVYTGVYGMWNCYSWRTVLLEVHELHGISGHGHHRQSYVSPISSSKFCIFLLSVGESCLFWCLLRVNIVSRICCDLFA